MDYEPWHPMDDPVDLKTSGKLIEELGECTAAMARCQIQGIDGTNPETGEVNREWLQKEIADVWANTILVAERFGLDVTAMQARAEWKMSRLREWHKMA